MDQNIISSLLDFGALGLFASFLVWLHVKTQKRLEEAVEKFQATVKNQEIAHTAAEDLIRTRYDSIIARHESQRQSVYDDVVKKLDDHSRILDHIQDSVRVAQAQRILDPTTTRPDR